MSVTIPPECMPSRAACGRIRGSAKNGKPKRMRCKGKVHRG